MSDESSQVLDEALLSIRGRGMEALVSPAVEVDFAKRMPELVRAVEKTEPAGDRRECLVAGLWVRAGDLDRAHKICQEIPTMHGSAWHAVVHRREGDFSNSKYWWQRASRVKWKKMISGMKDILKTPEGEALRECVRGETYDPASFVDLVEREHQSATPELRQLLVNVQRLEWESLFEECRGSG